jgi:hypothetical protein
MIRGLLNRLGERAQILSQALGITSRKEAFNSQVCTLPNWNCAGKHTPPFCRQGRQPAAAVTRVCCDLDQTSALQRLESGRQGSPVHCE